LLLGFIRKKFHSFGNNSHSGANAGASAPAQPQGYPSQGYQPQAYTPQGHVPQAYPPYGYTGPAGAPPPYPQGFQPGNEAPGGPAANSAQILGTTDIHLFDDNNQNAQNPHYKELRNKARSEGDKMANAFKASKAAYAKGDGARAKELSNEGNMHKQNMEQLNREARLWIFAANNADSPPDTVDLHGLYVKEALAKAEEAVQKAQAQNFPQLKLIVGKGIHSRDHVAHVKPAVEDLLRKYHLNAHVDKHNAGIVVVNLQGSVGGGQANFTRDIAQQATGDEQEVCEPLLIASVSSCKGKPRGPALPSS